MFVVQQGVRDAFDGVIRSQSAAISFDACVKCTRPQITLHDVHYRPDGSFIRTAPSEPSRAQHALYKAEREREPSDALKERQNLLWDLHRPRRAAADCK